MAPFPDRMDPLDASLYAQVVGDVEADVGFEFSGDRWRGIGRLRWSQRRKKDVPVSAFESPFCVPN